jgi:hypothetical protein
LLFGIACGRVYSTRTITATEMAKERGVKNMQKKLKKLEALLLAAQRSKGN